MCEHHMSSLLTPNASMHSAHATPLLGRPCVHLHAHAPLGSCARHHVPARLQHNIALLSPHRLVCADACMHLCVTLASYGCPHLHPCDRAACAGSLPHTIHVPTCAGSIPKSGACAARCPPDSRACTSWLCGRNARPPTHLSASLVESARPPCMRCT
jgi:hypothetical protein